MSDLNYTELSQAIANVRKAYRLLHDYQKRILDTVNFIGSNLNFEFQSGWAWFSKDQGNKNNKSLNRSGWDWLNMYEYEFFFGDQNVNGIEFRFSILHQADTGYYDGLNSKKDSPLKFPEANESISRLIFMVGRNNYWDPRNVLSEKLRGKNLDEFSDENQNLFGKAYEMKCFINEDSTRKTIANFVQFCKEKYGLDIRQDLMNSDL